MNLGHFLPSRFTPEGFAFFYPKLDMETIRLNLAPESALWKWGTADILWHIVSCIDFNVAARNFRPYGS